MTRLQRRTLLSVLCISIMLSIPVIRLGWEWKQALDNVDAMIVPTMILPTSVPNSQAVDSVVRNTEPFTAPTAVPEPDGPINILLLGADLRPGEESSRTDAIILVRLDPQTSRVSMLSFPRDLWVNIPGQGKARINAAYPIGERKLGPGYGPALAKATVSNLVHLPVNHFVLINFDGFKALIDKIGGIYVDVPKQIDDPAYPSDNYGIVKIHFDAGRQFMNGDRALIYARTRHADSDFGRNQRQQQILMAIFERVREQGLLTQITSLDDYTGVLRDYIRTDMSRKDMLSLASFAPKLRSENIQRYAIDSTMLINLKQPATFAADPEALDQLIKQMLSGPLASTGDEHPSD